MILKADEFIKSEEYSKSYDALIFEVTSQKKMVGVFDMDPSVKFKKIDV